MLNNIKMPTKEELVEKGFTEKEAETLIEALQRSNHLDRFSNPDIVKMEDKKKDE